ncbi:hypothetical protein CapIbe_010466, partial [Capra ibex]
GPFCQLHASDESSTEVSARCSATSSGSPVCCWFPCVCSPAARSDGPDITYQEPQGTQLPQLQQNGPCFYAVKQFSECAQSQGDVKFCDGFSEVLK